MAQEIKILQSQHRQKFNTDIEEWLNKGEGWQLMHPIQGMIFPDLGRTYYLATLIREVPDATS